MTSIYSKLESIYDSINDLIEEEEGTWYPDRKLSFNHLTDLEEVRDLLGSIIHYEPTEFSDGAYRVHYDCLTEKEKQLMEENNA